MLAIKLENKTFVYLSFFKQSKAAALLTDVEVIVQTMGKDKLTLLVKYYTIDYFCLHVNNLHTFNDS